jgi:hypothetical protein
MSKFYKLLGWVLSFVKTKPRTATRIDTVSASIVGAYHRSKGKPNEDRYGAIYAAGNSAFYVVDGAGGEIHGFHAAAAIAQRLDEIMPELLSKWENRAQAEVGLLDVARKVNQAALAVKGKATLILFISFPSGQWALLQVGDAVFVGRDRSNKWVLPIRPIKFTTSRNATELLGVAEFCPSYCSGDSRFDCFFLTSDWVCGSQDNSILLDASPNGIIGNYQPNQEVLDWVLIRLLPEGQMFRPDQLEALLVDIQREEVSEVPASNDDMTLTFGVIQD